MPWKWCWKIKMAPSQMTSERFWRRQKWSHTYKALGHSFSSYSHALSLSLSLFLFFLSHVQTQKEIPFGRLRPRSSARSLLDSHHRSQSANLHRIGSSPGRASRPEVKLVSWLSQNCIFHYMCYVLFCPYILCWDVNDDKSTVSQGRRKMTPQD